MATYKKNDKLTVSQIVVKKLNRNILDVGKWRTALKAADNGKREKLYELYEDILVDGVLADAIDKRIRAITNAEIVFMRDKKAVGEMDDMIDSPAFEEMLAELMNAKFWGKTVLELDFSNGFNVHNIPRTHLVPERGIILLNTSDENGVNYRGDDFFIEAGNDKDLGKLLKAAPYAIFKRGGVSDWAQFCELFGVPLKIGKYSAQDEVSRSALEEAFRDGGGAGSYIIPRETEIDIKESSTRGEGNLFNNFRRACNEEILVAILSQTMTTLDGSSRSQSEVHKEVAEEATKADRRFIQRILNTELLPRLEKRGFSVKGGWFTFPDAGETISTSQMLDMHVKFQNELGLPIDKNYLYDFYGWPRGKEKQQEQKPGTTSIDKPEKEGKDEKMLAKSELSWLKRLFGFFRPAR